MKSKNSQAKDVVDRLGKLMSMLNNKKYAPQIRRFKYGAYQNPIYQNSKNNNKENSRNGKYDDNNLLNKKRVSFPDMKHDKYFNNDSYSEYNEEESSINEEEEEEEEGFELNEKRQLTEEEELEKLSHPIPIKSNARLFMIQRFYRKWRKALKSRQIQRTLAKKIEEAARKDRYEKKQESINKNKPRKIPKLTHDQHETVLKRLAQGNKSSTNKKKKKKEVRKIDNAIFANPDYKPKTELERKKIFFRRYVRNISNDREVVTHKKKKYSQKEIEYFYQRISKSRPARNISVNNDTTKNTENESKKPNITYKEQKENSIRLSESHINEKQEEEKAPQQNTPVPTKEEQFEASIRLSQPKPDFTEDPVVIQSKLTKEQQEELNNRLSIPRNVKLSQKEEEKDKKKKNENTKESEQNKSKKRRKKKKGHLSFNVEKKSSENPLKTNSKITNSARSKKSGMTTPRSHKKVRFNGVLSSSKKKEKETPLSTLVNQAIGDSIQNYSNNDQNYAKDESEMKNSIFGLSPLNLKHLKRENSITDDEDEEISLIDDISAIDVPRKPEINSALDKALKPSPANSSADINELFEES